jgi:hypothetical protein
MLDREAPECSGSSSNLDDDTQQKSHHRDGRQDRPEAHCLATPGHNNAAEETDGHQHDACQEGVD